MNFLSELQIQQKNKGVSTGTKWLSSKGVNIESFSPVDGKIIASVKSADKESYEAVLAQAQLAFGEWMAMAGFACMIFGALISVLRKLDKVEACMDSINRLHGENIVRIDGEVMRLRDVVDRRAYVGAN